MQLRIRDFIYLDIDRLKSIIAQIENGLINEFSDSKSGSKEISLDAEGGLAGLLKAAGGMNFLWQSQHTETKTLHDNIYDRVEEILLHQSLLVKIPEELESYSRFDETLTNNISDTAFVLVCGKVTINDFRNMRIFLENFNVLGKFLSHFSGEALPENTPRKEKSTHVKAEQQKLKLDETTLRGLMFMLDLFYGERVEIKIRPYDDNPDFRLVGNLSNEYLRDDIASIIYKYGTAPVSKWKMLAQIASIPSEIRENEIKPQKGSSIGLGLQNLFDNYRELELIAQSVVFPEIAVTPIAIYRE